MRKSGGEKKISCNEVYVNMWQGHAAEIKKLAATILICMERGRALMFLMWRNNPPVRKTRFVAAAKPVVIAPYYSIFTLPSIMGGEETSAKKMSIGLGRGLPRRFRGRNSEDGGKNFGAGSAIIHTSFCRPLKCR